MSDMDGITSHLTTCSNGSCSTDWNIDDALRAMREFRAKFPLSKIPVGFVLGRGTLFDLEMVCGERPHWQTVIPVEAMWVRHDGHKPPNWAEIEYADGHREQVYWFGQVRGNDE